jgi:hypothetical protein
MRRPASDRMFAPDVRAAPLWWGRCAAGSCGRSTLAARFAMGCNGSGVAMAVYLGH